jgi:peptide subunit release factor 1 (eRF1)
MATIVTSVDDVLARLATITSAADPVVSLYVDLRPDQNGRRRPEEFFTRAFNEQIATFEPSSSARRLLQKDADRIGRFLANGVPPSAKSAAVFSCSGDPDLFETLALEAPIDGHRMYIDRQPHLFPLARLADEYAKYAALLVDTNSARLYVFAIGAVQRKLSVQNEKASRTPGVDVFSEGEYQRNSENLHLQHMKEVAAVVDRVLREDGIRQIFVAAGPVALPMLREALSRDAQSKLVEMSSLDMKSPDAGVLRATLQAFKETNIQSDRDDVVRVLNAFRARGLGTIGLPRVRAALTLGQVDRLLVPAVPAATSADQVSPDVNASTERFAQSPLREETIEELVLQARRTDAAVTFIEDASLLVPAGGVAAFLRFQLADPEAGRE